MLTKWSRQLKTISPRRELRYALLAAMETCWLYAILLFLLAVAGAGRVLEPLVLFLTYWFALWLGRVLPHVRLRWSVLQTITVGLVVVVLLAVVRVELYGERPLSDLSWLSQYASALFSLRLSAPLVVTAAILFIFVRGLRFGQRPLTLWFIGFQFRLGIVAFFTVFLLSSWYKPIDAGQWVFAFFAVALVAVALARLEDTGVDTQLGPRWLITLGGAVALVLFLGAGLLNILTLSAADMLVKLLIVPMGLILGLVLMILLIPASYLVGLLVEWFRPFFANSRIEQILQSMAAGGAAGPVGPLKDQTSLLDMLAPFLKLLFMAALVVGVGVLLARALNRRMGEIEQETYERESIGAGEETARRRERKSGRRGQTHPGGISTASIRRMYAALVAQAARVGVARRAAETPYELLPRLEEAFPEQAESIDMITRAYIAVHYGEQDPAPAEVNRVREAFGRVQRSIRRKR